MVKLTRIDGSPVYLNLEAIMLVEETPSTVVRMREGEVLRVQEPAAVIVERVNALRVALWTQAIQVVTQEKVSQAVAAT